MLDLNHLPLFAKVVETGSFTAAARALALPKATVSRKIARLEAALGARLLHRTTRRLELTALGRAYHEEVRSALEGLALAERRASNRQAVPAGTLRIAAPIELGASTLVPLLPKFFAEYPKIDLELVLADGLVDLLSERIDAAFRTGSLKSSSLVSRKLATTRRILVASPAYLEERGVPKTVRDLEDHDAIVFGASLANAVWRLQGPKGVAEAHVRGRLAVDSARAVREAVTAGLGIALLPVSLATSALADGTLRHVLPTYAVSGGGLYLVHASERRPTAALRAFLDFCVANLRRDRVTGTAS